MSAFTSTILAYIVIGVLLWGYALKLAINTLGLRGNASPNAANNQTAE